jgi:hypothetical protein
VDARLKRWRRYGIGAIFLVGLGLLMMRAMHAESATCTIVFHDAARCGIHEIEVELLRPGQTERLGMYQRRLEGPPAEELGRWALHADAGTYDLAIDLRGPRGKRSLRRSVELTDRAVVTVEVGDRGDCGGSPG